MSTDNSNNCIELSEIRNVLYNTSNCEMLSDLNNIVNNDNLSTSFITLCKFL
jgi:hypothetical protein